MGRESRGTLSSATSKPACASQADPFVAGRVREAGKSLLSGLSALSSPISSVAPDLLDSKGRRSARPGYRQFSSSLADSASGSRQGRR